MQGAQWGFVSRTGCGAAAPMLPCRLVRRCQEREQRLVYIELALQVSARACELFLFHRKGKRQEHWLVYIELALQVGALLFFMGAQLHKCHGRRLLLAVTTCRSCSSASPHGAPCMVWPPHAGTPTLSMCALRPF